MADGGARGSRRLAREYALRALYAYELSQNPLESVIEELITSRLKDPHTVDFAVELVRKTVAHQEELDKRIRDKALNWDFDRIAVLDKIILRMGICEFLYFEDIPPKVTINEAIEIAKKYSTEKSGKFVNGILDSVLGDLRREGKLIKSGRGLLDSRIEPEGLLPEEPDDPDSPETGGKGDEEGLPPLGGGSNQGLSGEEPWKNK